MHSARKGSKNDVKTYITHIIVEVEILLIRHKWRYQALIITCSTETVLIGCIWE